MDEKGVRQITTVISIFLLFEYAVKNLFSFYLLSIFKSFIGSLFLPIMIAL